MNLSFPLLIVGFLLLGALASIALVWALRHTAEGCEDDKGFHHDSVG